MFISRREISGIERYNSIIWQICIIDLDALFTGTGTGEFVGMMLKRGILTPPNFHLYPIDMDGSNVVYAKESYAQLTVLQLFLQVTVVAIRLALLAQEFRRDLSCGTEGTQQRNEDTRLRQGRIFELQERLRELFIAPAVIAIGHSLGVLPVPAKRLFERAAALYQACIIYSYTSMWSTQRSDMCPNGNIRVAMASKQILLTTSKILRSGRADRLYLVFPLFMAGFASSDGEQKSIAIRLIESMESDSIRCNASATRKALMVVYEKQRQRFMMTGQNLDVDWMDVIREQHMPILNFGL